jgi:hypothetical protein
VNKNLRFIGSIPNRTTRVSQQNQPPALYSPTRRLPSSAYSLLLSCTKREKLTPRTLLAS